MHETVTHDELGEAIARLRIGVSASDLHGSLTGYLCAGGEAEAHTWPDALELDPSGDGCNGDAIVARLYRLCRAQLEDDEFGFEPLLPGDERPLTERGDALVEWCRGFLGGIGLAGGAANAMLSENAAEILRDLGTIAASRFDYDGDEGDEAALIEVLEFVRIGVLLLHAELRKPLRTGATPAASRRLH